MAQSITKKVDGLVLDVLYSRVKDLDASTLFAAELVQIDEAAADGLDEGDKDVLKSEQSTAPGIMAQRCEFMTAHRAKVNAHHAKTHANFGPNTKEGQDIKAGFLGVP